jgi:hypothetical protein
VAIVDLLVDGFRERLAEAPQLPVMIERDAERSIADLGLGELVARITIAAVRGFGRIIGEPEPVARLRDFLAATPICWDI